MKTTQIATRNPRTICKTLATSNKIDLNGMCAVLMQVHASTLAE
jgi:hypothetical protein